MEQENVKKFMKFLKEDVRAFINLECGQTQIFYGTIEEIPEHIANMQMIEMCFETEGNDPTVGFLVK